MRQSQGQTMAAALKETVFSVPQARAPPFLAYLHSKQEAPVQADLMLSITVLACLLKAFCLRKAFSTSPFCVTKQAW